MDGAELKDIQVDKIRIENNSRLEIGNEDLSMLMQSIKDNGLLEPIGVIKEPSKDGYQIAYGYRRLTACRKLGFKTISAFVMGPKTETELLVINTIENIQRKDISPLELGRMCSLLVKQGLSLQEIAIRLSIPKERVKNTMSLFEIAPDEFKQKIVFREHGNERTEGVSFNIAKRIGNYADYYSLSKEEVAKLYGLADKRELTDNVLKTLHLLLDTGMKFDDAVLQLDDFSTFSVNITIRKQELEALKSKNNGLVMNKIIKKILRGDERPLRFVA